MRTENDSTRGLATGPEDAPARWRSLADVVTWVFSLTACAVLVLGLRDTPRSAPTAAGTAATATARPSATVCADVVDGEGRPVPGAKVRAYFERPGRLFESVGEVMTNGARACLEVPLGSARLIAEAEGFSRASLEVIARSDTQVTLRLAPARSLRISVVDELSAPLRAATVLVTASDPLPYGKLTDAEGRARFDRLPPGAVSVRASAPGYESATRNDVTEDTTLTLRRLAAIDVHVVDASGSGVAGASVLIASPTLWPARRAVTDAAGLAKIRGLAAGSYDLSANEGARLAPPLVGFELARGAQETVTLRLEPGRMVTALVTDGEGAGAPPVPGADVILVEGGLGSFPHRGRTGAAGTVVLGPIGLGPSTLTARAPDFVGGPLVNVPPSGNEPIQIPMIRGATLRGDVVDARGYPIGGAQIEVVGTDRFGLPIAETPLMTSFRAAHFAWSLGGPRALIPSGELGVMPGPVPPIPRAGSVPLLVPNAPANGLDVLAAPDALVPAAWISDRNGAFVARPVTPGRVRALVRHPEYVEGTSDVVALPQAGEARVRVVLLRGGRLEGRVVDDRGFPASGADVKVVAERGTFERSTVTGKDGSFAFAAVPRSVTVTVARAEDLARIALQKRLDIPEGERKDVELVLPARRESVQLFVTDERGAPIGLAEVRVASLDPAAPLRLTLFTDDAGTAELADAAGLSLRVSVDAPRYARVERDFERAPRELRLTLDAGVTVSGRVTAVRGRRPAANAVVTLRGAGQRKSTMTDADGAFRFTSVAVGSVEITVTHPDYAETTLRADVRRTERADRPFELPAIDLEEPCAVSGRVVDAGDRPVEGARVAVGVAPAYLPQGALPAGVAVTDRDGRFTLRGLAPGEVRLQAYAAGVGRGQVDGVRLDAGRDAEAPVIRLTERDADAEPTTSGGVAVTLGERADAVVVVQVAVGSEAERGGLVAGDVILQIDAQRPSSMQDARARLSGPSGSDVIVVVERDTNERRLRITREPVRR